MKYIILVRCVTPESTKIYTYANGVNQVFESRFDAEEIVVKMNKDADETVARIVCL